MRAALLLAALLAALGLRAAEINGDWRVSGDAPARPVQAFDDGRTLYIQLRDPTLPPAPFGPNGPLPFKVDGPYIRVPVTDVVTLRFGSATARVERAGAASAIPGVVSVTAPVDPLAAPLPSASSPPLRPVPEAPLPRARVEGVITVVGPAGRAETGRAEPPAAPAAPAPEPPAAKPAPKVAAKPTPVREASKPTPKPAHVAPATGSASGREVAAPTAADFAGFGSAIRITADGTTDGAKRALAARAVCQAQGKTCTVRYVGARPGLLKIENAE